MAGTTPTYGFPYPTASDTPAGHTQMQALATAVENRLITTDANVATVLASGQPKGTMVGYAEITADSATWSSATKVVTNVRTTFTAIAGAVYAVEVDASGSNGTANTEANGIGWRLGGAGTVINTDPIIGPRQWRSQAGGALVAVHLFGRFTAVSSGTHEVAVMGWKPTGDTSAAQLRATTASGTNISTNIIRVTRVA